MFLVQFFIHINKQLNQYKRNDTTFWPIDIVRLCDLGHFNNLYFTSNFVLYIYQQSFAFVAFLPEPWWKVKLTQCWNPLDGWLVAGWVRTELGTFQPLRIFDTMISWNFDFAGLNLYLHTPRLLPTLKKVTPCIWKVDFFGREVMGTFHLWWHTILVSQGTMVLNKLSNMC